MEKFKSLLESKRIDFYEFSYTQRNQGLDSGTTTYVAISKGDAVRVEKWFKKNFSSFTKFEKSTEKAFMWASVLDCYVNTTALGRGFDPLSKKEGLKQISESEAE